MGVKSSTDRYGTVAIAIHWVSAAAIIGLLVSGTVAEGTAGAGKASILVVHATVGTLVLLLTLARVAWWLWADKRPAPLAGQPAAQEWLSRAVHGLLYLAIFVLTLSGIATLALSGAVPALLGQGALPDFSTVPPRFVHGIVSKLMIALVAVHTLAALYHQFIRRDRLLGRMGLGRV
jgi:cytochrome b561